MARYVPDRGDVVWLAFSPQAGHEQAGWRPALILSGRAYNQKAGLALACPITSQIKGYPFEVRIDAGPIHGAVLADQVRCVDWRARAARPAARAPADIVVEVGTVVCELAAGP